MVTAETAKRHSSPDISELLCLHPELRIQQDDYNINVTSNNGERVEGGELLDLLSSHRGSGHPMHLYFHVPFCSYICRFCNYVKQLLPQRNSEGVLDRWTSLLIEESRRHLRRSDWLSQAKVTSFFIGGGTASLLSSQQLRRIIDHVSRNYDCADCAELTLEGNPDDFDGDLVREAVDIGFNRFSVGVQSLQSKVNAFAGRGHDPETSLGAIQKLQESGLPFNVDLMFGLPYQTVETVAEDVETLVGLGVPTITIYRFRNAERHRMAIGTRSAWNVPKLREQLHDQGLFPPLETTYRMRKAAVDVLLSHEYWPSPCGWWSAPGSYPSGNIPHVSRNKWQRYDTMAAIGPGAYGWYTGDRDFVIQTHNKADIHGYAKHLETTDSPPLAFGRVLRGWKALASALAFAFKANQPIELSRFRSTYDKDLLNEEPAASVLRQLIEKDLLHHDEIQGTLIPTLNGEALHEEIISVYLHGAIGGASEELCRR